MNRLWVAVGGVASFVVISLIVVGATYGGLAAYTVHHTDFDIAEMQVKQLDVGNTSWSVELRVVLWCNNTRTVGTNVRVTTADVQVQAEGEDMGEGHFGPITINPNEHRHFSGTVGAENRPLAGSQFVTKLQAREEIAVVADLVRVRVWGINVELPRKVRVMNKRVKLS
eukprot:m51a1_g14391 hypothetical protein (169) ;mRNA; f:324180-324762